MNNIPNHETATLKRIIDLKKEIQNSIVKIPIVNCLEEIIRISQDIKPRLLRKGNDRIVDNESKENDIKSLQAIITFIEDGTFENIDTIKLQSSLSITTLLITLYDITVDQINEMSN